ncbi:glycoside hydrolase family 16 protein [Mycena polygramma]|nr:glycoside hydrolase family 16 protein [Mycena polygramma]
MAILTVLFPSAFAATTYDMVKQYSGLTFFDGWDFYGNYDNLTNGDVIWVNSSVATTAKLAYVDPTTKRAIIKVDNTSTVVYDNKRNSVRITSQDKFGVGSVWIADMYHVPFGCSVWPAFWSQSLNWPTGGYGAKFAAAQGGVFVTEYAETGISVWFFNRSSIPSSISGNVSSLSTSDLGTPVANWPTGGCAIGTLFQAQHLIFDITLCGGICLDDYVWGNGSVYNNTYFDVASVRVYSATGSSTSTTGNSTGAVGSSTSAPVNVPTPGSNDASVVRAKQWILKSAALGCISLFLLV